MEFVTRNYKHQYIISEEFKYDTNKILHFHKPIRKGVLD